MNFNKLIPELSVLVAVFCSNSRASNPVVKSKEVLLMLQQGSIPNKWVSVRKMRVCNVSIFQGRYPRF
ncbi:hypothetical protein A9D36_03000 [Bacillus subtilis]|nr:hypothetical protein A9D36_03000 [Bacillus subtilis]